MGKVSTENVASRVRRQGQQRDSSAIHSWLIVRVDKNDHQVSGLHGGTIQLLPKNVTPRIITEPFEPQYAVARLPTRS